MSTCDICREPAVLAYVAQDGSHVHIHVCADCVADMAIMNSDNCLFFFDEEWTVRQIRAWQRDHQHC